MNQEIEKINKTIGNIICVLSRDKSYSIEEIEAVKKERNELEEILNDIHNKYIHTYNVSKKRLESMELLTKQVLRDLEASYTGTNGKKFYILGWNK